MVFDNIYLRFAGLPSIIHLLTRFVAPLFAWLMVEGFFHTHSRKEYCKRLWIAAVLMQIGDFISLALLKENGISDNIFLTLAISFSVIWLIDTAKKAKGNKKILLNLGAVALAAVGMVISEGGLSIIPFVLSSKNKTSGGLFPLLLYSFLYALWWLEFSHKTRF
ncbi:TraX family protein [Streptococcus gallolyticus]|nr:TraX family protein [Streptococcus gallolyticus]